MASFLHDFTLTRTTLPDWVALLEALRALDASASFGPLSHTVLRVFKDTAWTAPQITAAQNTVDTSPAVSPQLTAQEEIDQLGVREKAILLTLLDQINVIRAALTPPLGAITPAQAIAAVRAKAGTL